MSKMIFIPGMRPANVSGAAGASGPRSVKRLVSGPAYRGMVTPRNIIPYEEPRRDSSIATRKKKERAQDVSDALHFVRDAPNSARDRVNDTRGAAESAVSA